MTTFLQRLMGAAVLDATTYEGIEADRSLTGQAMLVVLLSALAAGIALVVCGVGWVPTLAVIVGLGPF